MADSISYTRNFILEMKMTSLFRVLVKIFKKKKIQEFKDWLSITLNSGNIRNLLSDREKDIKYL